MNNNDIIKSNKEYRFNDNPEEQAFFETFVDRYYNRSSLERSISHIIHGSDNGGTEPKYLVSEDELNAFMAAIQWLGSPVGQSFLVNEMKYNKG